MNGNQIRDLLEPYGDMEIRFLGIGVSYSVNGMVREFIRFENEINPGRKITLYGPDIS